MRHTRTASTFFALLFAVTAALGQTGAPPEGGEPAVVYEEGKVAGGIRMRGPSRIDTTRAPAFFDRVNVYFDGVFSDYRRFGAEFDSHKLAAPKAQD